MLSEKDLIQRCVQHKDARAFEVLVSRHQSALRYSLRELTGWDEAQADDLAQITFIKAYRALASFRMDSKFSTWLYRIAYNEFVSQRRKPQLEITDTELPLADSIDSMGSTEGSVARPDEYTDLHRDLAQAMLLLNPEQRAALHLTLHRQCTQQEVAEIMGCPLGTVKSHILRGREKLKQALAEWREVVEE